MEPVKFPYVPQKFSLPRVVVKGGLRFAGVMLCKRRKSGIIYNYDSAKSMVLDKGVWSTLHQRLVYAVMLAQRNVHGREWLLCKVT